MANVPLLLVPASVGWGFGAVGLQPSKTNLAVTQPFKKLFKYSKYHFFLFKSSEVRSDIKLHFSLLLRSVLPRLAFASWFK